MKTTVIHHSADFDGLFCREIARNFLPPDTNFIGWNFGDLVLSLRSDIIYVLDLPIDRVFGIDFAKGDTVGYTSPNSIIWIDHHKTAIESHPHDIPGYRIDGVAACRLAWQWFSNKAQEEPDRCLLPEKHHFVDRQVIEPLAVRLAGEYDIHDKRMETEADIELFQCGLKGAEMIPWDNLLSLTDAAHPSAISRILSYGHPVKHARDNEYSEVIKEQGFTVEWEGLTFLCCCSHELDIRSQLFEAGIQPVHDALMGFTYTGRDWRVSLYGVPSKPHIDLSAIAKKHGGGGHRQACGFRAKGGDWLRTVLLSQPDLKTSTETTL